jgi:hypothetical protein
MNTLMASVKPTYRFPKDHGLTLRAVLNRARDADIPVAIAHTTLRGGAGKDSGYVQHVGPDTVRLRVPDRGDIRIELWRIDRADLVAVIEEAA